MISAGIPIFLLFKNKAAAATMLLMECPDGKECPCGRDRSNVTAVSISHGLGLAKMFFKIKLPRIKVHNMDINS